MDSLDLIRTFREVAAHGSFSHAAKRLDMSKATASKYVAELESRFGVRLLNRSTRSVSLTAAGQLLLERSQPMLDMIELTEAELQEHADQPRGRLRIAAPVGMGSGDLPNLLAEFLGFYPEVSISLQLSNHTDLVGDGIDLELRFGPIENENLIVRKLLQMPMVVCASPDYWTKHGVPPRPETLAGHAALTLQRPGAHPVWRFEEHGRPIDVTVRSRMEATENAPLIQVATQGMGVVYVPALAVQPHMEQGALIPVLQEFVRKDMWLSAAYLQRKHNSAALRALLDFLQSRITERNQYVESLMARTRAAMRANAKAGAKPPAPAGKAAGRSASKKA